MDQGSHDRVVRYIADNRFPFPGQTTWPADYVTLTNVPVRRQGIPCEGSIHYPDILVVDATGQACEIGEVEYAVGPDLLPHLRACSDAADDLTPTKVRHFFLYVPLGLESAATALLDQAGISYAGVRSFHIDDTGAISITPHVTHGDSYDHQ
ncbi:hypothetical protein [Acidisoma silvae]|uniref:Uncharacterized protein n=1 Tax=Acidisoma silvae TaxID=2802396 RepID=A0A964E0I6_9PROT|nr:hypothetical protein [Acidisoma silvae]MCB8877545.1 hypothetical protein [Acidisoma silvae]